MNDIRQKVNASLIKEKKFKEKKEKYIYYVKYVFSIIFPALIVLFVLNFLIGIASIKGTSMEQNLHESDIVIFNRLDKSIERLDIIVAKKENQGIYIIKRVIGLPNDLIDIKDGNVYVNNIQIDESLYTLNGSTQLQDIKFPIQLSSNEYFLLGDNRSVSLDSRNSQTGLISKDHILGKVIYIIRGIK